MFSEILSFNQRFPWMQSFEENAAGSRTFFPALISVFIFSLVNTSDPSSKECKSANFFDENPLNISSNIFFGQKPKTQCPSSVKNSKIKDANYHNLAWNQIILI